MVNPISIFVSPFKQKATCEPARPLALESLGERVVPAYLSYGDIIIDGTNAADHVTVKQVGNSYQVQQGITVQYFEASKVTGGDLRFTGYAGDDVFYNQTALRSTASGGDGNDFLSGGSARDYLDGGNGSDWLLGNGGHDRIIAGYDYSYNYAEGGDGDDLMYGGYGYDEMYGMAGNDDIFGNAGTDWLDGGAGNDDVRGDAGDDWVFGGDGHDFLVGDVGNDHLYGGSGNDLIYSDSGFDYIDGGTGYDGSDANWYYDTVYNVEP
jgi:Ca2+-binding RTX toxin-like protein